MRLYLKEDPARLSDMVNERALSRDTLEKAVGDKNVALADALLEHAEEFDEAAWLSYGLRKGLARLNHSKATAAFIRDLRLNADQLTLLAENVILPFARNCHGQLLVAMLPGWPVPPAVKAIIGEMPILCVTTLAEARDLRLAYHTAAISTGGR